MKVLHLIPSFTGGGAERQLSLLAPAILAAGAEVEVGYVKPGVHLESLLLTGVRLHQIAHWGNHDPLIFCRLCELIREVRPDLVQTWLTQMDVLGGGAAQLMAVPHVLSERSSALAYRRSWKNSLRRTIGSRSSGIVANSQSGLEYWQQAGAKVPMQVIRNGMPAEAILSAGPARLCQLGLPSGGRLVLCAGRLVVEKNWFVLLDALDRLLERELDVCVAIFGEGELRGSVERRIAMSRFSNRIRLEPYTNEIWSWMQSATLVVSTSLAEGSPNFIIEAMIACCPLVVSDIKEHRELLDESMAVFCDPQTSDDVARKMREALESTELAAQRARVAYGRAIGWTVDLAAQSHVDFYRQIRSRENSA